MITAMITCLGCLAFPLFLFYDYNQITKNRKLPRSFFLIGCILITAASAALVFGKDPLYYGLIPAAAAIFGILAMLSLALLIFTLFFAFDFGGAYVGGSKNALCRTGVYGACRHPGVVLLFAFYVFTSASLSKPSLLIAGAAFTALNTIYVFVQDRCFFPKLYEDYGSYRVEVPFIIPNKASLGKCIQFYKDNQFKRRGGKPR